MRNFGLILVFLVVAVFQLRAGADDSYTLKRARPDRQNDHYRRTIDETRSASTTIKDSNGKVVTELKDRIRLGLIFDVAVSEKETGKKATKLTFVFERAVAVEKGDEIDLGLKGKTVVAERKGKSIELRFDNGQELPEKPRAVLMQMHRPLANDADSEQDVFLPKGTVRIGETWQCERKAVLDHLGDAAAHVDDSNVTAGGQLVKLYRKGGRDFGVISIGIKLPLLTMRKSGIVVQMNPGSFTSIDLTWDIGVDGGQWIGTQDSKLVFRGTGKFVLKSDGKEYTVEVDKLTEAKATWKPLN